MTHALLALVRQAPLALAPSVRLTACAFLHVKLTIQMHIAVILPLPAFFSPLKWSIQAKITSLKTYTAQGYFSYF